MTMSSRPMTDNTRMPKNLRNFFMSEGFMLRLKKLSSCNQGTYRPAQGMVIHHINNHTSDTDRTFHPNRNVIGIIAYPHIHLFTSFKNGPFNQQWFYFKRVKLTVPGLDGFLSHVTDIN